MGFKELGEFGFIRRIRGGCLVRPAGVIQAIGDDAAAFRTPGTGATLVTTDLMMEGVHFLREAVTGEQLGHKALAVNLSDIAAMGGTPREAFVSLALPEDIGLDYMDAFYEGMIRLARRFQVNVLGGDTTRSLKDMMINVAVIGNAAENRILYRNKARPGDRIMVTGMLGDSAAGLYLIRNRIPAEARALNALVRAHHIPIPHVAEGRFLAQQPGVHAAIDVSDGFASDLTHILEQSGVGARIEVGALPISGSLRTFCSRFQREASEFALDGGEDYVLLITVERDAAARLAEAFRKRFDRPLHPVGEIVRESGITLVKPDDTAERFSPSGWDHFLSKS